jgi:hypothetical protein
MPSATSRVQSDKAVQVTDFESGLSYLHTGIRRISGLQHPSRRFQLEQAVHATDFQSGGDVGPGGVQLVQSIDP